MPKKINKNMNLSINGQSQIPPGFRFHPTEEELLHYYLRKKVSSEKNDLDVIREVDLNKLEPWDIQERCRIGSALQNDWYFFSHKDKKYPTGTRTNRATAAGFWKATGRDKIVYSGFRRIGLRKTLVFYIGRAPHGQKSDWIMHEYRLDDDSNSSDTGAYSLMGESMSGNEDGWVVCRVFKKKNYQKIMETPKCSSSASIEPDNQMFCSNKNGVLDQILLYMGRSNSENQIPKTGIEENNVGNREICIEEDEVVHDRFIHLPPFQTPKTDQRVDHEHNTETGNGDWVSLDRFVAWQLNGADEGRVIRPNFEEDEAVGSYNVDWDTKNQASFDVYGSTKMEMWSDLAESSSSGSPFDPLSQYFSI